MKMYTNLKKSFCLSFVLLLVCQCVEVDAQGFQKIFPNIFTTGYEVSEGPNGIINIKSDVSDPLTLVGSTVVAANGDLISHSTPFTKCYPPPAPFWDPILFLVFWLLV